MTCPLVFFSVYKSYSRINNQDINFHKKWGSLFLEFKNDRGFLSSQFYFLYYFRRAAYVFSQVYLNSNVYAQGALNSFFSCLVLAFLFFYKPFKDTIIYYSNVIGEITITIVMILTNCFLWKMDSIVELKIEMTIIFIVLSGMMIQFIISIYLFGKALYKVYLKFEKIRALDFAKRGTERFTHILEVR